jgi:hypothetical protein
LNRYQFYVIAMKCQFNCIDRKLCNIFTNFNAYQLTATGLKFHEDVHQYFADFI